MVENLAGAIWYSFERVRLRHRGKDSCEGRWVAAGSIQIGFFPFSAFFLVLLPPIVLSEKGHKYIAALDSQERVPERLQLGDVRFPRDRHYTFIQFRLYLSSGGR